MQYWPQSGRCGQGICGQDDCSFRASRSFYTNLLGPALTCQTCDATVFLTEEHPTASDLTATAETPQSTTRKVLRLVDGERR